MRTLRNSIRHRLLWIAGSAVLLGFAAPASSAWTLFQAPSGFSMELPTPPSVVATRHRSWFGDVSSCLYTASEGAASFSANVSTLPRWVVRVSGRDIILDRAIRAFLSDSEMERVDPANTEARWVRHVRYKRRGQPGRPDLVGHARFVLRGNDLYVFDAVSVGFEELAPAKRFLEGVRFTH